MNTVGLRTALGRGLSVTRNERAILVTFTVTLFLSALLMFSVQPMFAKMVLPRLGGSPSVWAVSMCFFQAVLLAGYCYAHLLNKYFGTSRALVIHFGVLIVAWAAQPIGLPVGWPEPPAGDAYFWLIGLLGMGIGVPFFAISASAPLLQAWFSRTGHPHSSDPYFLYGASNFGSLAALLSYPVLIEPMIGLSAQAVWWGGGFVLLAMLIAVCGAGTLNGEAGSSVAVVSGADRRERTKLSWHQRAAWIGLAFVPSGLLVAFTSYLTTDIASAPFLWVIPLAMFLGTFILVFREKPLKGHAALLVLQPALAAAVMFGISGEGSVGWAFGCLSGFAAFFVTTMVCHKELYDKRPGSEHLTEFYLWMSFGGVLGGLFSAVIAPQLFNSIFEFPLLLALGMMCRPGILGKTIPRDELRWLAGCVGVTFAVMFLMVGLVSLGWIAASPLLRTFVFLGLVGVVILNRERPHRQLVAVALMALSIVILPSSLNRGDAERSFFGIHRVLESRDGSLRLLMHGTTLHGAQRLLDDAGKPVKAPLPATYYYPKSPMARGVEVARSLKGGAGRPLRVGIVGLGSGSMACHAQAGEKWRFYEIDPVVVKIATDPKRFSFMSRCQPQADIVVGDARLTLAKEKAASFDYLVIDAFSSDAVPVHLLTVEALTLYLSKLNEKGLLALHVSNLHLDLVSVAVSVAGAIPGTHTVAMYDRVVSKSFDRHSSVVVFISKSEEVVSKVKAWKGIKQIDHVPVNPWTDDYSDVISAFFRMLRH